MSGTYDPWRFAGSFLEGAIASQIPETPFAGEIPWTPLAKPVARARIALLSTAGISMRSDEPFDMEFERRHPTRGDSSWRRLSSSATERDVAVNHLHIDTGFIERDLDVALPLRRLRELVAAGVIGAIAESHYSIMGFQGSDSSQLVNGSAPEIAAAMASEEVDLALLAPV